MWSGMICYANCQNQSLYQTLETFLVEAPETEWNEFLNLTSTIS